MKNYRELEIYNLSYELAVRVHKLTLSLPKFEMYEEGSQLRRASKSITANIVEGYVRRRYKADFIRFLIYSHASCDETILHLNFLKDTHKSISNEIIILIQDYNKLGSKLNTFIQYVEKEWK